MVLGLESGSYRLTLQRGNSFFRAEIYLPENRQTTLAMRDFSMIAAGTGTRRGDSGLSTDDEFPNNFFSLQVWPGFDITGRAWEKVTDNFLLALFLGKGQNINGVGAATFGLINSGYVRGLQASGLFNFAGGKVTGTQASGLFNIAGDYFYGVQASGLFNKAGEEVYGLQASGLFNFTSGDVNGLQASGLFNFAGGSASGFQATGLFNTAKEIKGFQASVININGGGSGFMLGVINISESENMVPMGVINVIKNGIMHPAVFYDDMLFTNISFRSGSKYFYSVLSAGVNGGVLSGSGDRLMIYRAGFGFEFTVQKFFINIDATGGNIINLDAINTKLNESETYSDFMTNISQLRLIAGYKIFPHLGVFAGLSYDYIFRNKDNSPDPEDFGGPVVGVVFDRHIHKLGFFGGIQF